MDYIDSRSPQDERREFERSRLIIDVFFEGVDLTGVASSKDISPGGLYMNTQADIPEGALLTVRVPFPEGDVVVNAEAVYSNPGRGVGLRFHGLTAENRTTIERALGD
ncbi:MAG TPA: PilZ domain-containing protein [Pyrinomonadaceae bacterium]